jgi:hypothetical protein
LREKKKEREIIIVETPFPAQVDRDVLELRVKECQADLQQLHAAVAQLAGSAAAAKATDATNALLERQLLERCAAYPLCRPCPFSLQLFLPQSKTCCLRSRAPSLYLSLTHSLTLG